ncbi:MAG: transcriptional regulator of arginine metabolism [Actinomycetota bacterium]|jgi:transcriptional regulator of arginine metabolism|nr:transcriptional regulator of arginine metabolism [Actinomycetota bacterium]
MIPQTRAGRRQLILNILGRQSVRSQGELLEILLSHGFGVTQATLSRDLLELGAVKVREGKTLVYAVPGEGGDRTARVAPGPEEVSLVMRRRCEELLVTARVSANLVVVRTPPGAANYLASAMDHAYETDILGTIAGDDTIMIITPGPRQSRALVKRLLDLSGRDQAGSNPLLDGQSDGHSNALSERTTDPTSRLQDDEIHKEYR